MAAMNILIAPNSLKHAADTFQVSDAIASGVGRAMPSAAIKKLPVADGGERSLEVISHATGATLEEVSTFDPLGEPITAQYGIRPDRTAVVELARASGIEKVPADKLNPLITSTYGTGVLIRHALEKGCRSFILALGGSATVDGGAGILQALGIGLFDKRNEPLPPGGGNLIILDRMEVSTLVESALDIEFTILHDVENPLIGARGAAMTFGPQKGAGPMEAAVLERCLLNFGEKCETHSGKKLVNRRGAGAAGGVAVGLTAFFRTRMVRGTDYILDLYDADRWIEWADVVITAEGQLDHQTLSGKAPAVIASRAKKAGKKTICLAGSVPQRVHRPDALFDAVFSLQHKPMSVQESISETLKSLENIAFEIGNLLKYGSMT